MKIFEIGTGYTPIPAKIGAATEIVVEELTRSFINLGQSVEIVDIASKNRPDTDLPIVEVKIPKMFNSTDVSLGIKHKLKRVIYSICLARKLKKILKNTQERVVLHFHNQYNLFFFLKLSTKKLRKKAIIAYTNHNGYWSLEWEKVENILKKKYFQEITSMKNADKVFVLNNSMHKNIVEHLQISESRVENIINGVNTSVYYPLNGEKIEEIKDKYSLSGKSIILQVGSVNENKGQERAVKALTPLLKENSNLVYAYAGGIISEDYYLKIQQTAKENGIEKQVVYLGVIQPGKILNEVYNMAEATVLVSNYESFGLVCIESLASGTPVILCTNNAVHFGDGCLVCEIEKLSNAIKQEVYSSKEKIEQLNCKARKTAIEKYSWDYVAKEYLEVLKQMI